MDTSGKIRRTRQGFTLVELLVVIVIIGILAGLITGAAIMARTRVRETAVLAEIGQINIALDRYKNEFGEYPPDFAFVNLDDDPSVDILNEDAAQTRVMRHLRKRFPRYRPVGDGTLTDPWLMFCYDVANNYGVDPSTFDAASALVFWLGGLPDAAGADPWIPRGFHSDPEFPFRAGLPRTNSFYEFDPERLVVAETADPTNQLRYIPRHIDTAPLVYFKAVRSPVNGRYEYGEFVAAGFLLPFFQDTTSPDLSYCVPYLRELTASGRSWESPEKYQIISSGLDSLFGDRPIGAPATPDLGYRFTLTGLGFSDDGGDQDNLTSFSKGKLEDGIE